jgi:hypothetical protein
MGTKRQREQAKREKKRKKEERRARRAAEKDAPAEPTADAPQATLPETGDPPIT